MFLLTQITVTEILQTSAGTNYYNRDTLQQVFFVHKRTWLV